MKRKTKRTPAAQSSGTTPWLPCVECGKLPQVVTADGTQHPFCTTGCAEKHAAQRDAMTKVPVLSLVQPVQNMCKGCGLYPQAIAGGFLFTHCGRGCARKWPLRLVRCKSSGCQEFISGAYGAYCAVAHKHLFEPQNTLPLPPQATVKKRSGTLKKLNPFRFLGWDKDQILFYDKHDPYFEFTNFSPHNVTHSGRVYPTSEHLYQSLKFANTRPDIAEHIRTCSADPRMAFAEARRYQRAVRPDWLKVNISMMDIALFHKFTQHPFLAAELLSTHDAELVEDSPTDSFWGIGRDRKGRNELGKALMRLRDKLTKSAKLP